ncbi:MAG: Xaa-Pro aminopeptidase, partial [Actinomyces urogenitalis DORA_12]
MNDTQHTSTSSEEEPQSLAQRGSNRSRQPTNQAFRDFIGSGWGPRPADLPAQGAAAPWAAKRQA